MNSLSHANSYLRELYDTKLWTFLCQVFQTAQQKQVGRTDPEPCRKSQDSFVLVCALESQSDFFSYFNKDGFNNICRPMTL